MSENYYSSQGVRMNPANPLYQDTVEIVYDGLLPGSGAAEVYAHVSFDRDWKTVQDYKMSKTDHGFETLVFLPEDADAVNICFRDSGDNWDNNNGSNYTFEIEAKREISWDKELDKELKLQSAANYSFLTEAGQDLLQLCTGNSSTKNDFSRVDGDK